MKIIKDKDLIWEVEKYDVILVGTTIYCMLSNGFQSKIRYKYPHVEKANEQTPYGDQRKLGTRLTVEPIEDGHPTISLLYIARYPHSKRVFLDYESLENALATANAEFKGKKVATTVLGITPFDGNGERERVLKIMEENTKDLDLDVYDYTQLDKIRERGLVISQLIKQARKKIGKSKKAMKPMWSGFDNVVKKLYLK